MSETKLSTVIRYDHDTRADCYGMNKCADGEYVLFDEYNTLLAANKTQAENIEKLREQFAAIVQAYQHEKTMGLAHLNSLQLSEAENAALREQLASAENKPHVDGIITKDADGKLHCPECGVAVCAMICSGNKYYAEEIAESEKRGYELAAKETETCRGNLYGNVKYKYADKCTYAEAVKARDSKEKTK